ncbi:MAG: GNAT family N-acetyltransferase [Rhodobacteraceae bacterium]|nr:GNAT family N-acetyltransferase [Paracoccaceae bacterium]
MEETTGPIGPLDSFLDFSIDTERLLLRPCRMEDADALTNLMTPEISRWVAVWPTPLSQQDTESILRNNIEAMQQGAVFAAVVLAKDSSDIIGWCKLDIAGDCAELGYWIGEEYQRQGFAMELLQGAIDFAFNQLGAMSVRAGAQVANTASLALLAKIGMTRDGVEAVWAPAREQFEDCEFWSLKASDKGLSRG